MTFYIYCLQLVALVEDILKLKREQEGNCGVKRVVLHDFDNGCNTASKIAKLLKASDVWLVFTREDLKRDGKVQKMINGKNKMKKVVCGKGRNMTDYKIACVVGCFSVTKGIGILIVLP